MHSGGSLGSGAAVPLDDAWLDEDEVSPADEIFGLVHRNISRVQAAS